MSALQNKLGANLLVEFRRLQLLGCRRMRAPPAAPGRKEFRVAKKKDRRRKRKRSCSASCTTTTTY